MASRFWVSKAASYLKNFTFSRGFASVGGKDLKYADSHEWVKLKGNSAIIGITDHGQDHLGDVVSVELPEVGDTITQGSSFGAVKSVMATSVINSPVSGKVIGVNKDLTTSPGLVNGSPYEKGWIIEVEISDTNEVNSLMNSERYSKFCEEEKRNFFRGGGCGGAGCGSAGACGGGCGGGCGG
ncbi:glycine cleavage system H protein 2, mitochondrial-like [Cynara cardunculus var. scolymus]|uniref:glycine cleavage system H protein 2, mitochondrial-like n=1 Tax=Cynara cardunculus var. scolymus TaxID=59895 RepID=UPI000D62720E|nr:glycine cleavage system H protein 2, mitochondrial-like [Cynara cardunculus var. scolymus]